jgi:hypothetical protein
VSSAKDWERGYARQAQADFTTFQSLQSVRGIPECHRLLFLQMACEKLCKAHLIAGGADPEALQTSHGYIANPLPVVVRQQIIFLRADVTRMTGVLLLTRHLAREIELLNPAVDRAGGRPDNCEYPWDQGGGLHSPLDWSFSPSHLLTRKAGRTFLKLVRGAIDRLQT